MMLSPLSIPGLFVTATDTDVGKTIVAGAIANQFARRGLRTAVCKPMATGCQKRREGLVSDDAEFLAGAAQSRHPLDLICPQRFVEPLAPAVAARRAGETIDWPTIQNAIRLMSLDSDVMVVEGAGGILVPVDENYLMLDVIRWLSVPVVVVARAGLGTINHTLMTVGVLRAARIDVAGVVINRYPAEFPGVAEETNPGVIEQFGNVPVLAIVPEVNGMKHNIPADIAAAIDTVDWARIVRGGRAIGDR
jgi:dethiobiotin synthetase